MTEAQARARLETMIAWNTDPALSSGDVDLLMVDAARPDANARIPDTRAAWSASHVYALGDELVPTTPNGHYYRVTVAGTSAASEPTWPTTSAGTVTSGTATFAEYGASWSGVWDLNWAAAEGWRWKAAKAAGQFNVSTDGQSLSLAQIIEHCNTMADYYAARLVESVPVQRSCRGGWLTDDSDYVDATEYVQP